ncbi:MAG: terminase family protein [Candidatus Thiodiazotropha sp. 6PLUC7]|nr:terminase family protein [Candidatus Thiodiazotropha lotti]
MTQHHKIDRIRTLIEELKRRQRGRKIDHFYPEAGPLKRSAYPKHMAFFSGGNAVRQRCMMAANRVGKTEGVGLYEMVLHLTGDYPEWWIGKRFDRPINATAAGDTMKTVRDIIQKKLLGDVGEWGSGLLPLEKLVRASKAQGLPDLVDSVYVKHASGGHSILTLKSYEQGRVSFQGTEKDVILLDEEPPMDIYTECLMRTMTTGGIIMLTFTPLKGMSEVVMMFLDIGADQDETPGDQEKMLVTATWDDAPHLSEADKKELMASLPPHQQEARSKGIPMLGSGAIYPINAEEFLVEDFPIPDHYVRAYGMDVGWKKTAGIWGAKDLDTGVTYLYSEHYRGQAEPVIHAEAIKARGDWIPGAIDPAARGRSQADGKKLIEQYSEHGLILTCASNAVESGIYKVWTGLSTGKIKVFKSLRSWLMEYGLYRRDEDGKVVKELDHLMDATRYLMMTGIDLAITKPRPTRENRHRYKGEGYWLS